ncbi:MAG: Hsp70 family protein, partial [Methylococcaceae bacterium]|nr:Hsp70 family protein [Methylococcaceae bacterium]
LSALILRSLKADAEALLKHEVREVIISVPAYFNDQQRKATRLAGELAGLTVIQLLNEPTAAALFHGIQDRDTEAKFLIFDLGGGTFDVSILEKFDGIMEVHATGGDSFLGGDDFTQVLVDWFVQQTNTATNKKNNAALMAAIRFAAESVKCKLSTQATVEMSMLVDGVPKTLTISQETFEAQCKPLLERLRAPIERALRDARLRTTDLDEVVLVGGATRMPIVRKLVAQLFARLPSRYIDPDQTIALGVAVCAGLRLRNEAFSEVVLTDVCPHSLGVRVSEEDGRGGWFRDIFLPIIERNTVIPASRVRTICTVVDNQAQLNVEIYQGESRSCSNNVKLGAVSMAIPPKPAGEVSLSVRYTYDINGILDVDVEVEQTGTATNLLIKELAGNVSDEDIERRRHELAALKIHPRDQEENRLALERANRLYEQFLGYERQQVGDLLNRFNSILETQDVPVIGKARQELTEALDYLEHSW